MPSLCSIGFKNKAYNIRMSIEKGKKQRTEKEMRQSLKTYLELYPHLFSAEKPSLLGRIYPQISSINSLRIFTVIEVLYLLQLCIDILQKRNASISEFRIGLIGGGITAHLILNSILPLSKDGLDLRNITLSTRQTDNFNVYAESFGIKVVFDNEETARQSDFLIICSPATLDNWIIADLKAPLQSRISAQNSKIQNKLPNLNKLASEKSQLGNSGPSAFSETNQKMGHSLQMSGSLELPPSSQRLMKPLVYILTSDFTMEKCERIFDFPVLVPSIRTKDLKEVSEKLELFQGDTIEAHEKTLSWWLTKSDNSERKIDSRQGPNELENYGESELQLKINKFYGTPFLRILIALNHAFGSPLNIASLGSSLSITVSVNESLQGKKREETMIQILQSATVAGEVEETLLQKCKKWRKAHNNFVA